MEPMILKYGNIILRDRKTADLADHRRWLSTETTWMDWDAPWEDNDPEENRRWLARIEQQLYRPPPAIRSSLEICDAEGAHIGLVNSYHVDGDWNKLAVGIGIRESSYWGRGLGSQAFLLWLGYQFSATGSRQLFCQTWTGNTRMVKLAAKAGFQEYNRLPNYRVIEGQSYDALDYVLSRRVFWSAYPDLKTIKYQSIAKGIEND